MMEILGQKVVLQRLNDVLTEETIATKQTKAENAA